MHRHAHTQMHMYTPKRENMVHFTVLQLQCSTELHNFFVKILVHIKHFPTWSMYKSDWFNLVWRAQWCSGITSGQLRGPFGILRIKPGRPHAKQHPTQCTITPGLYFFEEKKIAMCSFNRKPILQSYTHNSRCLVII